MTTEYIMTIGATISELVCTIFMLNSLLGKERTIPVLWAMLYLFSAAVYIALVPDEWTTGSYILVLLFVRFGYGESWRESFLATILCLVLVGIIELLCFFPFAFLFQGSWSDAICNLLSAVCSLILCFAVSKIVPVWYLKKWCNKKEVLYIAVVLFSLILMLTTVVNYHMTLELELGNYLCILVCLVLVWLLGMRLMKYRYEERIRKRYFDAFCSVIDQMKRRQHKFQNQMDAVYSLHCLYDDYDSLVEEQRKYLGKLADYEMPTDVLILENPIIIAHLYEKISEAQERGIRIRLNLKCSLSGCKADDIHLVEILGTLLDNAIQDMEETNQKEFLFIGIKEENGLIIRIANPHRKMQVHELRRMFEKGYSTKGEGRGIGLYHLRKLVQKYEMDLVVENRLLEGQNYICFSLVMGRNAPLV